MKTKKRACKHLWIALPAWNNCVATEPLFEVICKKCSKQKKSVTL